ncbi:MAG: hypothetical protein OEX75_06360, partial [Gammaproteobacteria bacterium]|nr:hypothetical protein [Gammaproteobacteria bacterium]
ADAVREHLWEKGRHRNALQVGFLQAIPDDLPDALPPHPDKKQTQLVLEDLCASGNPFARQYLRLLGSAGQTFLATVERIMKKPSNQDVMVELMHAMAAYNRPLPLPGDVIGDIDTIAPSVDAMLNGADARNAAAGQALAALLQALPQARPKIHAMLSLAMLDEPVLNPVFSKTDAIGTVMRKKLKPVTDPIQTQISILSKH